MTLAGSICEVEHLRWRMRGAMERGSLAIFGCSVVRDVAVTHLWAHRRSIHSRDSAQSPRAMKVRPPCSQQLPPAPFCSRHSVPVSPQIVDKINQKIAKGEVRRRPAARRPSAG